MWNVKTLIIENWTEAKNSKDIKTQIYMFYQAWLWSIEYIEWFSGEKVDYKKVSNRNLLISQALKNDAETINKLKKLMIIDEKEIKKAIDLLKDSKEEIVIDDMTRISFRRGDWMYEVMSYE